MLEPSMPPNQSKQELQMADSIVNGNATARQRTAPEARKVVGSSMLPAFEDGDIVIIDPSVQPKPGDFVVAATAQGREIFRMYRPLADQQIGTAGAAFELAALKEGFRSLRSDIESLQIVGTVVERRRCFALRDVESGQRSGTNRQQGGSAPWPSDINMGGSING